MFIVVLPNWCTNWEEVRRDGDFWRSKVSRKCNKTAFVFLFQVIFIKLTFEGWTAAANGS